MEHTGKLMKALEMMRSPLGGIPGHLQKTENANIHSCNWIPSGWAKTINASGVDIVNLHWVGGETLSVEDIGRIRKPVVWTLHDMWPFCGAEHYATDDDSARWRSAYQRCNRTDTESGVDLDRWVWKRKQRNWLRTMHIVCPSRWLANCAQTSTLFRDWPVTVIPNTLDTQLYKPLEQEFCRDALNLPLDRKIILFGATGSKNDFRKGYDLLLQAIKQLSRRTESLNILVVIFGHSEPETPQEIAITTRWMGHIHDDTTLALLYNAADVMVVPSRQENLPQAATEALACACPVVAFNCTGLRDVVDHRKSGYLARPYEPDDMAKGLHWMLEDTDRLRAMGHAGREKALNHWSPEIVIPQYLKVFRKMLQ